MHETKSHVNCPRSEGVKNTAEVVYWH